MDHLQMPSDGIRDRVEVPYVATEEYNPTRGDFLDFSYYHDFNGWDDDELRCRKAWDSRYRCADDNDPNKTCLIHSCKCKRPHNVEQNASFLQTWLFFGLLTAFLGRRRFRKSDFVRSNGKGEQVITTEKLPKLIDERAAEFNTDFSPQQRHGTEMYWETCLQKAHEVYTFVSHSSTVDVRILLSIGVLGETLVGALNGATAVTSSQFDGWKHESSLAKNEVTRWFRKKMLANGWCPADIERLGWFSLSDLYFINNMASFRGGLVHGTCDLQNCKLLQDCSKDYQTKHVSPDCHCKFASVDSSKLDEMLRQQQIPLVLPWRDTDTESDTVELESSRYPFYVAISHVWADGLGSRANSLPQCQLRRLTRLVQDVYPDRPANLPKISFWIDTIACPASPGESKIKALQLMGETYKQAHSVLVLDASLMGLEYGKMSKREIVIRIFLSTWVRRLWCYQEGIFAQSLYFQFADGPWEFDLLEYWAKAGSLIENDAGAFMLSYHYQQIRDRKVQRYGPREEKLWAVANAIRGRSTSKQADEAICLASLLDLDVKPIAVLERAEQRMKAFWQCLSPCYRSLVFWQGECLRERGYRWAPRTLMSARGDVLTPFRHNSPREELAIPTSDGLLFQFPGINLGKVEKGLRLFWLRNEKIDRGRPDFPFFVVLPQVFEPDVGGTELALILRKAIDASTRVWYAQQVLLTKVSRVEDDVIYGTTVMMGFLCGKDKIKRESTGVLNEASNLLTEIYHRQNQPTPKEAKTTLINDKHAVFDLSLFPATQKWCVERDTTWIDAPQDDNIQIETLTARTLAEDIFKRSLSFLNEKQAEANVLNELRRILEEEDDDDDD